jgi:hypothetical protein
VALLMIMPEYSVKTQGPNCRVGLWTLRDGAVCFADVVEQSASVAKGQSLTPIVSRSAKKS